MTVQLTMTLSSVFCPICGDQLRAGSVEVTGDYESDDKVTVVDGVQLPCLHWVCRLCCSETIVCKQLIAMNDIQLEPLAIDNVECGVYDDPNVILSSSGSDLTETVTTVTTTSTLLLDPILKGEATEAAADCTRLIKDTLPNHVNQLRLHLRSSLETLATQTQLQAATATATATEQLKDHLQTSVEADIKQAEHLLDTAVVLREHIHLAIEHLATERLQYLVQTFNQQLRHVDFTTTTMHRFPVAFDASKDPWAGFRLQRTRPAFIGRDYRHLVSCAARHHL